MADDLPSVRPVVPHERPAGPWTRRGEAALPARRQQLRGLRLRPGQAFRALYSRRLRDRRRDPLPAGRRRVQSRRTRAGPELGDVPRRDRRLRRGGRARPPHRVANGRSPSVVPVPAARAERDAGDRERARPGRTGSPFLPHDDGRDRRQDCRCTAPRNGRAAGLGALRAVGGSGGRARGAVDRRRGPGPPAIRRAGVLVQHRGVGLDSLTAPGRVLGREPEGIPRMATRGGIRGDGVGRRELRLPRRSRTSTSRPGTSATEATSSSTTSSSGAKRSSGWPTQIIARRSRWRWTTRT